MADEPSLEALRGRMDASEQALLREMALVERLVLAINSLKNTQTLIRCHIPREFTPDIRKLCHDLQAELHIKSMQLYFNEETLKAALETYIENRLSYLGAMDMALAGATPNPPVPPAQTGLVARLKSVEPCILRSGGRPSERSNYTCDFELTLTNETDKPIFFTAGTRESDHPWNGTIERANISYGLILQPGRVLTMGSRCTVPHDQQTGTWRGWRAGEHWDGEEVRPQFDWHLEVECSAPPPE